MKKGGAKKAKETEMGVSWAAQKPRRAARMDLTWRADELSESDSWRKRAARSPRPSR
jgi:hypothetical protein